MAKTKDENVKNYAIVYRCYMTEEQAVLCNKTFGCCRWAWNAMLSAYINSEDGKVLNPASLKDEEHAWLREVDSLALTTVWKYLCQAIKNHLKNPEHFKKPKHKSKKHAARSYTTQWLNNNIRFSDDHKQLKLPKLGWVKIKGRRPKANTVIKSATVSQSPTGEYYVSVLFAYENQVEEKQLDTSRSVGLDMSMSNLYIPSTGTTPPETRYFRAYQKKLRKAQRRLSKLTVIGAEKQSNNYHKQLKKVNKIHKKIANCRKDHLHKESKKLADSYDYVFIEDLNMAAMGKALRLGKSVNDLGWNMFTTMLDYKLRNNGGQLIKVGKRFPSSQLCSVCGTKNPITKNLKVREWTCPHCGTFHNRDKNAAINILNEGLRLIAA